MNLEPKNTFFTREEVKQYGQIIEELDERLPLEWLDTINHEEHKTTKLVTDLHEESWFDKFLP